MTRTYVPFVDDELAHGSLYIVAAAVAVSGTTNAIRTAKES